MSHELIQRLRLQPHDGGGPSGMDMLWQRQEAADDFQHITDKGN
jgi:hypothetical protein